MADNDKKPGKYGIERAMLTSRLSLRYWKTLAGIRAVKYPEVSFDGIALQVKRYPFEPSTAYPSLEIHPQDVAEIVLGWPPEVRLRNGDIVFVSQSSKEALLSFSNRHAIEFCRRLSTWGELLDPFLDTWKEQSVIDRQFQRLEQIGLDREEVNRLRLEVAPAMMAYNFGSGLWEWTSLGLYDVLQAQRASLNRSQFHDFYQRALKVAQLDQPSARSHRETKTTLRSALHSVVLDWYPHGPDGSLKSFQERWKARSDKLRKLVDELSNELSRAYGEPHRHYHTKEHVENCLTLVDEWWDHALHLNEVRWALIFHDAIYDPRRSDNERMSADWACRVMGELERPAEEIERVRDLILATEHTGKPKTPDQALLIDIDLSILGASDEAFSAYDAAVRKEYAWVSDSDYRAGRTAVLRSFLDRGQIYSTTAFRGAFEGRARKNIKGTLDVLNRS